MNAPGRPKNDIPGYVNARITAADGDLAIEIRDSRALLRAVVLKNGETRGFGLDVAPGEHLVIRPKE